MQRVEVAGALTAEENRLAMKILNGETKGIKFNIDRMREGETRTSRIRKLEEGEGVGREPWPVHCTGKEAPFPTMI